jgi:putative membrane protein
MSAPGPRRVRPFELDPSKARPIDLPPEDQLPGEEETPEVLPPPAPKGRRWLGWGLGTGIVGVVGLQTVAYIDNLMATDPWLGLPLAILTSLVAVTAAALFAREMRDLLRLQRRARLRERAARMSGSELHGESGPLLEAVASELLPAPGLDRDITVYRSHATDVLDDGERLRLFERTVLAPIDRRAYRLVLESARDIGLLTALSPLGLLDGVLVLWRTMLLLRAVARLYGMTPGTAASLSLLRRSLRNAALAGLADVVTHAATEHIGASLAAMLSARAGQGAGNALLAAKLGIEAIKASRPLPFVAETPPSLRNVRIALLDAPVDTRLRD